MLKNNNNNNKKKDEEIQLLKYFTTRSRKTERVLKDEEKNMMPYEIYIKKHTQPHRHTHFFKSSFESALIEISSGSGASMR